MQIKKINIAIDGPSGSGKGTTSKLLAKKLGMKYLDTGAMYRAVAFGLNEKGVTESSFKKEDLEGIHINFNEKNEVMLNNVNVEDQIRTPIINTLSSVFAQMGEVREFLSKKQQEIVKDKGYVAEGRDIGSVIIPDAELKIYLNANLDERSRRRLIDFQNKGIEKTFEEVKAIVQEKDFRDTHREIAPLVKLDDAIEVDTTGMTIQGQVDEIFNLAIQKSGFNTISVGSSNKVKIQAVQEVFNDYNFVKPFIVKGIDVESNVCEQPMDLDTILTGAQNRAKGAFEKENSILGVGIESGFHKVSKTQTGYMELSCVCIYDGKKFFTGFSSGFEVTKETIDEMLNNGLDLSQAAKKLNYTNLDNIGAQNGIVSVLTNGRVSRKSYTKEAIIMALIHLENKF